ncbi:zf-TFIIB domain-containing protein [Arthrobacter parietis]|uniref:Zf-TFIIB domain-containing protein n=1 Tax=Arthrobacter parietis TaxID=271434 RepID=A0ABP5MJD4_9MICC
MLCPVDKIELVMSERSGVEIDYCPTCRGVWLDRGELDKIIDRAGALTAQPAARPHAPSAPPIAPPLPSPLLGAERRDDDYGRRDDDYRRRYDDDARRYNNDRRGEDQYGRKPYRKKKDNWLGEMFDF